MRRSTRALAGAVATLAVAALAAPARADDASASATPALRFGGTMGVALGAGHLGCGPADGEGCDGDGSREASSLALHAGWMVTPRFALIGKLWGVRHRARDLTIDQGIAAAAARGWVVPWLWLEGGIGVARATAQPRLGSVALLADVETVPALIAGIGIEVLSTDRFVLDLQLQGGSGMYEGDVDVYNVCVGAGVTFF